MASLITSLYTGASGIFVNQSAIQVTGNNIANVNTTGYSRQSASITSSAQLEQGGLLYGTGSTIDKITRSGDAFITKQLNAQSAAYGEYDASSSSLSNIQQSLSIGDSSLSTDIDDFFDAWEALSNNPSGTTERQQVLQQASDLADRFHQINQQLAAVTNEINTSIEAKIPTLNEQLQQIASLNTSIMQTETSGGDANTLRDQRDVLVQQVSETSGATSYTEKNGMVSLQLSNGLPLVTGAVASTLSTARTNGALEVSITCNNLQYTLDSSGLGGELKGLLSIRDTTLPTFQSDIDQLAYTIATDVNSLHTTGIDQNGNAGANIFNLAIPTNPSAPAWQGAAGSLAVNFSDPSMIAAGTTSSSGDNSLAVQIAQLRDTASIGASTYTEEYSRIAAKAGLLVSGNEQKMTDSSSLLDEIKTNRDAVAGVSTDEEMVSLIKYQTGYEAASKYLSTIKDMLDTLVKL